MNFSKDVIRYTVKKIQKEDLGCPTQDAQKFVDLLSEDSEKRQYFFKIQKNANHQLENVCFMTHKMKMLANQFLDVIILDATHKTNRFNLPLLDIIVVDQFGKSRTCFIALLCNQKEESFIWALEFFKLNLDKEPVVIFSDEDEALVSGNFF